MLRSGGRIFLLIAISGLPASSAVAGEPAWWTQQKANCHVTTSYNTWVAQGSPCNSGSSGVSSTDPSVQLGTAVGSAIGNALIQSVQQAAAENERRRLQMQEENRLAKEREANRLADQARNDARQNEQAIDHLQGVLKLSGSPKKAGSSVSKTAHNGAQSGTAVQLNPGARSKTARDLKTVDPAGAIPSSSAKGQLLNSGRESTGQLFDNGRGPDDATVDTRLPNVATPSAQPLDARFAKNKDYQKAAAELTKAQATADALNKKMASLTDQQNASPTSERQTEIYNLSGQMHQANGAVLIANNNLDTVKKKIVKSGPAIVVDDGTSTPGQSTPVSAGN